MVIVHPRRRNEKIAQESRLGSQKSNETLPTIKNSYIVSTCCRTSSRTARVGGTLGKHGSGESFFDQSFSFPSSGGPETFSPTDTCLLALLLFKRQILIPKWFRGGQGEPFYRDPEGFEKGIWMWMNFGRDVFTEKWGRGPCDLREAGLVEGDAWKVVKDWENPDVRKQFRLDREKEVQEQVIKDKAKEKEIAKEMRAKKKPSA